MSYGIESPPLLLHSLPLLRSLLLTLHLSPGPLWCFFKTSEHFHLRTLVWWLFFFLFVFCLECSPRWFTMPTSSLSSGLCPLNISFSLKSFLTIHSNLCDYPLYLLLLLSFFLSIYYHLKFYLFYLTF